MINGKLIAAGVIFNTLFTSKNVKYYLFPVSEIWGIAAFLNFISMQIKDFKQNKQFEDATWRSRNFWWYYLQIINLQFKLLTVL